MPTYLNKCYSFSHTRSIIQLKKNQLGILAKIRLAYLKSKDKQDYGENIDWCRHPKADMGVPQKVKN